MPRIYQIIVEIYESENSFPIVVHVFQGKTKREAIGYHQAHLKYDQFLRECETGGCFNGRVPCETVKTEGWANV